MDAAAAGFGRNLHDIQVDEALGFIVVGNAVISEYGPLSKVLPRRTALSGPGADV